MLQINVLQYSLLAGVALFASWHRPLHSLKQVTRLSACILTCIASVNVVLFITLTVNWKDDSFVTWSCNFCPRRFQYCFCLLRCLPKSRRDITREFSVQIERKLSTESRIWKAFAAVTTKLFFPLNDAIAGFISIKRGLKFAYVYKQETGLNENMMWRISGLYFLDLSLFYSTKVLTFRAPGIPR